MGVKDMIPDEPHPGRRFNGNQYTVQNVTDEGILNEVKRLANELGRTPTSSEASELDTLPSEGPLCQRFGTWNNLLSKAGLEQNQDFKSDEDSILKDMVKCYNNIEGNLTIREYMEVGGYAPSTVKKKFGSWKKACSEAGIQSGNKHGETHIGPKGNKLDSRLEFEASKRLCEYNIDYETHKRVPGSDWITDFYIRSLDVWVEVNGYDSGRPNLDEYKRKMEYYDSEGLNVVEVKEPEDIITKLIFDV